MKQLIFEAALAEGVTRIFYVPGAGLALPEELVAVPQPLDYVLNGPNPVRDLIVNEHGIEATLSFSQRPTYTFVPWQCVTVIVWQSGVVQFVNEPAAPVAAPTPAPTPKKDKGGAERSYLRLVR